MPGNRIEGQQLRDLTFASDHQMGRHAITGGRVAEFVDRPFCAVTGCEVQDQGVGGTQGKEPTLIGRQGLDDSVPDKTVAVDSHACNIEV